MTASKPSQRARFSPFAGAATTSLRYCYRCPYQLTFPSCDLYCAKILDELVLRDLDPAGRRRGVHRRAGDGRGGLRGATPGWHKAIRTICDKYGILFISDEVQAGHRRTGHWFGIENFGVGAGHHDVGEGARRGDPDGSDRLPSELDYTYNGAHSNTFGGNAVAAAASLATLDVVEGEHLMENARRQGEHLSDPAARAAGEVPGDRGRSRGRV